MLRTRRRPPSTGFIEPCLPSNAPRPPAGDQWMHEVKQDGFRLMARRDAAGVRLLTRNGHDWTSRFPQIAAAVNALAAAPAWSTARRSAAMRPAWRSSNGCAGERTVAPRSSTPLTCSMLEHPRRPASKRCRRRPLFWFREYPLSLAAEGTGRNRRHLLLLDLLRCARRRLATSSRRESSYRSAPSGARPSRPVYVPPCEISRCWFPCRQSSSRSPERASGITVHTRTMEAVFFLSQKGDRPLVLNAQIRPLQNSNPATRGSNPARHPSLNVRA